MNSNLKCPKCKSELVVSGMSRHQDLVEHVTKPNGIPALKEEYRCKNKCYPHRVFWDYYGDVYISPSWLERLCWKLNIYSFPKRLEVPQAIKDEKNKAII
jgi:hypothetical protein